MLLLSQVTNGMSVNNPGVCSGFEVLAPESLCDLPKILKASRGKTPMDIYCYTKQGDKIGPVTKEGLIELAESGILTEESTIEANGKKYIAGQVPSFAQIFKKSNESEKEPQQKFPPKINLSLGKVTQSFDKAVRSADKIVGSAFDKIQESEKVKDIVRRSGRAYGSASKNISDFTSKHFRRNGQTAENNEQPNNDKSFARKAGSLYASASKFGLAPELQPTITPGDPLFNDFWKSYRLFKNLIKLSFIILTVCLVLCAFAISLYGVYMTFSEGGNVIWFVFCEFLVILLTVVLCILVHVAYRLVLMPYYWMGSMVRGAEDNRAMKMILEEHFKTKEEEQG